MAKYLTFHNSSFALIRYFFNVNGKDTVWHTPCISLPPQKDSIFWNAHIFLMLCKAYLQIQYNKRTQGFMCTNGYPWPSDIMKSLDFFKPRETHNCTIQISILIIQCPIYKQRRTNTVFICAKDRKKHLRTQLKTSCKNLEIRSEEQSCKAPEIKTLPKRIPFLPGRAQSSVCDGPELRHGRT
jgi:hypothetical protein